MKKILILLLVLSLLCVSGCASSGSPQASSSSSKNAVTLNILNWGDYIDESILDDFQKEYSWIHLNYSQIPTNEEMLTMLEAEGNSFDIAFPSDYIIERLIKEDKLAKIDKTVITNFDQIIDHCKNLSFDPNNDYSVPYMWGTVGILYNTKMVTEPVDSWSILWNQKYSKQILMYDSVRDSMMVALCKLGYDINTRDEKQLQEAEQALIEQKPLVLAYAGDDIKDKMIGGSAALGVVYSGDAVYCMQENPDLAYVVPKEGSNLWFDNIVIMKSCKNVEAAELFVNYLCRPDIALRNTEYIGYSTPIKGALDQIDKELYDDPTYNPPADVLERCTIYHDLGDFTEYYNTAWMRIKAS